MAREDDLFLNPLTSARPVGLTSAIAAKPPGPGARPPTAEAQARQGLQGAPVSNLAIPAQGRALLATIGGPGFESNGSYTQRFNQPDFSDFSKHPGTYGKITRGPNAGLSSNAAGRYQFLSTTYADQAKKLGLKDFSPESQDKAAWNLAQETYKSFYPGRDLASDLNNPANLPQITRALKSKWTSLPGGIEQGGASSAFGQKFAANLQSETARTAVAQQQPQQQPPQPLILTSDPWAQKFRRQPTPSSPSGPIEIAMPGSLI